MEHGVLGSLIRVRGRGRALVWAGVFLVGGSAQAQMAAPAPSPTAPPVQAPPAAPPVVPATPPPAPPVVPATPPPTPATRAAAKVIDVQLAAGYKRLPRDPVSGIMFGENGGFPQTAQLGFAGSLIITPRRWPIGLTVGVAYATSSRDRGYEETVSTTELGSGLRKTFDVTPAHLFVGAGWALGLISIRDTFTNGEETWNGAGSGGYLEAGGFIRLLSTVDLGLALRYSRFWREVERTARFWDAGGFFAGLLVGVAP